MTAMTDAELKAILAAEIADSLAHLGGELSEQRRKALRYYLGEPFGNEQEGRSKVVSTDVADVVEWILPSLLKIFTAGDEVVRFEPTGPEDEEVAKQATEYVNWIFARDNAGFLTFYTLFKDALLQKNGIAKVWWEEGECATRESYQRKSFDGVVRPRRAAPFVLPNWATRRVRNPMSSPETGSEANDAQAQAPPGQRPRGRRDE